MTQRQIEALTKLASVNYLRTGYMTIPCGIAGSTLRSLVTRGFATSSWTALFNVTHYEITNAGKSALRKVEWEAAHWPLKWIGEFPLADDVKSDA